MKSLSKVFWPKRVLYFFYRRKALGLSLIVGVLLFAVAGIFRLELEADTRKFLPSDTAERRASDKIRELYSIDSEIVIAYTSRLNLPVTDARVMARIQELSDSLQGLSRDVNSQDETASEEQDDGATQQTADMLGDLLGNAEDTQIAGRGDRSRQALIQDLQALHTVSFMRRTKEGDGLEQRDIGPAVLQDGVDKRDLQQNLLDWGLYNKALYSDDFRYGAIVIQPGLGLSSAEHQQLYQQIVALLDTYQDDELRFFLSGEDVIQSVIGTYIMKDLVRLIPLLGLIVCAILLAYFRRCAALLIILFPVFFTLLLTIGLMGWLGIKFTFIHASIPVIIMALGSADSIHSLSLYRQLQVRDKLRCMALVQHQLFVPISLTSLTTGIGFLSFAFSVMLPIRSFGLFSALGIGLAWLASVFITPLLLPLYRNKPVPCKAQRGLNLANAKLSDPTRQKAGWLWRTNQVLLRHPYLSRSAFLLLCLALLAGIPYVSVNNDTISYFQPKSKVVQASEVINEQLGGMYSIHISVHSERPGGMVEPRILRYMAGLAADLKRQNPDVITKSIGFPDFVARLSRLLNPALEQAPPRAALPAERQSVVQYLSLFAGNLSSFTNPDIYEPQDARLSLYLNNGSKDVLQKVLADIEAYRQQHLPSGYSQLESGYSLTVNSMNRLVVREQIQSILIAIVGVFIAVLLCFRSLRLSLLACLPSLVTLLLNFSLMALLRIDLNISTALINSLVIGVGIDYSIHLISAYRHQRLDGLPAPEALQHSLLQVGNSILLNAGAVGLGYATLLFSQFRSLSYFGGLSALANIVAAVLTLLVLPLLLVSRSRGRIKGISKNSLSMMNEGIFRDSKKAEPCYKSRREAKSSFRGKGHAQCAILSYGEFLEVLSSPEALKAPKTLKTGLNIRSDASSGSR